MSDMVVRTNITSVNSHSSLGLEGTRQVPESANANPSHRANTAAVGDAVLDVRDKIRAQFRESDTAVRNAQDYISLIQAAEGAIDTVTDRVARIRELAVQSASGTAPNNRAINALLDEIDGITRHDFGLSPTASAALIPNPDYDPAADEPRFFPHPIYSVIYTHQPGFPYMLAKDVSANIRDALDEWAQGQVVHDAVLAAMELTGQREYDAVDTPVAGGTEPRFADFLSWSTWMGSMEHDAQGTVIGYENLESALAGTLGDALNGLSDAVLFDTEEVTDTGGGQLWFSVAALREAGNGQINQFLNAIDDALAHMTARRAYLNDTQNSLASAIENPDSANSRIHDSNMAAEMMRRTQTNVLEQASVTMLAQANQSPQSVLQLLRS